MRSWPSPSTGNAIALFFPPVLRHTAFTVPATLLGNLDIMAIRLKDLALHLNLSVPTVSAQAR
jgi:hypothetical protein